MMRANGAEVYWDTQKKSWIVRVQVGEEVVRRACKSAKRDADDSGLRTAAIETARDDGYELDPDHVTVRR